MTAERLRVLEMLQEGKITATEAAELLRALGDPAETAPPRPEGSNKVDPRWFRLRVTDTASGRPTANVSVPYGMVNMGLRFAPGGLRFGGPGDPHRVDDLISVLRSGQRGTIYDVTDSHSGKRIEIIVE